MAQQLSAAVSTGLQSALVDLVDLALLGKQAHWNIAGAHFRSVHLHLDEVIDHVRGASDDVAERLVAIGGDPDARAGTVSNTSQVEGLPAGQLAVDKVIRQFEERLQSTSERIKESLPAIEPADPLSHDLLVAIATGLEKQAWMFRAATE